jgi:hypothetical protein
MIQMSVPEYDSEDEGEEPIDRHIKRGGYGKENQARQKVDGASCQNDSQARTRRLGAEEGSPRRSEP